MEHLQQTNNGQVNNYYLPKKEWNVDGLLCIALVLLVISIVATYLIPDIDFFAGLSVKDITLSGVWVCLGSYAVGELAKRIITNKAKRTKEYKSVKAETVLMQQIFTREGYVDYVDEYCAMYEEETLKMHRKLFLDSVKIDYKSYEKDYLGVSAKNLPNTLTKAQKTAIKHANKVKKQPYNPNFLRSFVQVSFGKTPSQMYDVEKADKINSLTSLLTSILGSLFAVSVVGDIVLDMSPTAWLLACIKLTVLFIVVSTRISFAWKLVMNTGIERMLSQQSESIKSAKWALKNHADELSKAKAIEQILLEVRTTLKEDK